jgi:adenylosuccinate lyase
MPDSTILADYVLSRLARLLRGLVVRPENMLRNMGLSRGIFFSQRLLTALVDAGLPRQRAYEDVQRLAMRSWDEGTSFPDLVRHDEDMVARLDGRSLDDLFDPAFYLAHEERIFSRVFPDGAVSQCAGAETGVA